MSQFVYFSLVLREHEEPNIPHLSHNNFSNEKSLSADFVKGRIMSGDVEGFSNLQTRMPNYYLKLLHPVRGNDRISIECNIFQVYKHNENCLR